MPCPYYSSCRDSLSYCVFLLFKRVEDGVRASPDAARSTVQVARKTMAAAVRQDARRLVGHNVGGVYHLRLQANLLVNMLAVLDFKGFPGFFSHFYSGQLLVYRELIV